MSGLVNKVKDALHSDKSNTHSHTEGTHTTGTHTGTHGTTGGLHEPSHLSTGTHEGAYSGVDSNRHNLQKTDGPHGNLGNKLDPRVDSDRDHSRNLGANPDRSANTTSHTQHSALGGSHHTTGLTGSTGHTTGHTTGLTGTHGTTGGLHEHSNLTSGTQEGAYAGVDPNRHNFQKTDGPHGNIGNKLDPRVDSDRDHSRNLGANPDRSAAAGRDHTTLGSSTGTTGLGSHTGHTGHTTGHSATGAAGAGLTSASGPAPNTLGPHKSDVLNKVDPRVDSDADGSKTYGGNKTFSQ